MSSPPPSPTEDTHYRKDGKSHDRFPNVGDVALLSEYIVGRLYFATFRTSDRPQCTEIDHFFSTDDLFIYVPYNYDFGPLCLSNLIRYCCLVMSKLSSSELRDKRIIHYTSLERPQHRANATLLMTAFAVLCLDISPSEALDRVNPRKMKVPPLVPFRDASLNPTSRHIRVSDCLSALRAARLLHIFDPRDFDVRECERARIRCDLSWVVPRRLVALGGPRDQGIGHRPATYVEYFKTCGVVGVVRLNQPEYDKAAFLRAGIRVHDLYFPDGTPPTRGIARAFLRLCTEAEEADGALAVHCRAGLGRTGVLIASRLVSRYGMGAREAVAWVRLCRPGSVMSCQQEWLEMNEGFLKTLKDRTKADTGSHAAETFPYGIHSTQFRAGSGELAARRLRHRARRARVRHGEGGKRRLAGFGTDS